MFAWALASVVSLVGVCWGFFFDLISPMAPGNTGVVWFTGVFMSLFVVNKFIDLFVMNFIYSPSSGDATTVTGLKSSRFSLLFKKTEKGGKS